MNSKAERVDIAQVLGLTSPPRKLDEKGFVFLDDNKRPFWCRTWGGDPWLFRLTKARKWVSLRKVNQADVWRMPNNLTEKEQDIYRDLVSQTP